MVVNRNGGVHDGRANETYLSFSLTSVKKNELRSAARVKLDAWVQETLSIFRLPDQQSCDGVRWQSNGNIRLWWQVYSPDPLEQQLARAHQRAISRDYKRDRADLGIQDVYFNEPGPSIDTMDRSYKTPLPKAMHSTSNLNTPPASPKLNSAAPSRPSAGEARRSIDSASSSSNRPVPSMPASLQRVASTQTLPNTTVLPAPFSRPRLPSPPQPPRSLFELSPVSQTNSPITSEPCISSVSEPPQPLSPPPEPVGPPPPPPPPSSKQTAEKDKLERINEFWATYQQTLIDEQQKVQDLIRKLAESHAHANNLQAHLDCERNISRGLAVSCESARESLASEIIVRRGLEMQLTSMKEAQRTAEASLKTEREELEQVRELCEQFKVELGNARATREQAEAALEAEKQRFAQKEQEHAEAFELAKDAQQTVEAALQEVRHSAALQKTAYEKTVGELETTKSNAEKALAQAKDALTSTKIQLETEWRTKAEMKTAHAKALQSSDRACTRAEGQRDSVRAELQVARRVTEDVRAQLAKEKASVVEYRERANREAEEKVASNEQLMQVRLAEAARSAKGEIAQFEREWEERLATITREGEAKAKKLRDEAAAKLVGMLSELEEAQREFEAERARCRQAERRVIAERRRADVAERACTVAEQRAGDLERELACPQMVPAVLEMMREMSRMTAEATKPVKSVV